MSSEVDICNLALSHLGDTATVASIDPPEGSAQAEHCARFYPIARNALLEMHSWGFATKRANLAMLSSGWPEWDYAYALPADAVNIMAILPPESTDDYAASSSGSLLVPQPFSCEINDDGTQVIYTDQVNAVLRYTALVTNPVQFSPLFRLTLSHYLASMLAGPILKGDVGAAEAKRQLLIAIGPDGESGLLGKAKESDAGQRRIKLEHMPASLAARG